jgi:chaperonin cofactor prefoldin
LLVSIIFLQNKKSKYLIEQTNFRAATIENQQKQLSTQINGLQSNIMRMSAQMYRLQGGESK